VDVGYYAPAARTTLNLAVFIVFLGEIDLRLANPRVHTLWAREGAFRHPAVVYSTTTNEKDIIATPKFVTRMNIMQGNIIATSELCGDSHANLFDLEKKITEDYTPKKIKK